MFAATKFGHGVYFAHRSSLSESFSKADASGVKVMFLAHVLTGDFCLGNNSLKVPPVNESSDEGYLFDSVVNNESDPTIFVVFKDTSVYPSYLISFK